MRGRHDPLNPIRASLRAADDNLGAALGECGALRPAVVSQEQFEAVLRTREELHKALATFAKKPEPTS